MKGVAHFISGVALASCCPWATEAALHGNPVYFILGGFFGLLPDTLDFKFYRFFYHHDQIIQPDPFHLDPQEMADQIAAAISESLHSQKIFRLKINTLQVSADSWQQFKIRFDTHSQGVEVEIGPLVSTGQMPIEGTAPKEKKKGFAKLPVSILDPYGAATTVDIFDGPSFGFEYLPEQKQVQIHFLPWHRSWSHSFAIGIGWGLLFSLILGWQAGVIVTGSYGIHILEDQLGFMGSNLWFPFSKHRTAGLGWMHSTDALPNFTTVWFTGLLIFWNLSQFNPDSNVQISALSLFFFFGLLPLILFKTVTFFKPRIFF
jgi:hypothetical protein